MCRRIECRVNDVQTKVNRDAAKDIANKKLKDGGIKRSLRNIIIEAENETITPSIIAYMERFVKKQDTKEKTEGRISKVPGHREK